MKTQSQLAVREDISARFTGRIPFCNGCPHRAPKIPFTNRYLLCYRCYAFVGGIFSMTIIITAMGIIIQGVMISIVACAAILPMVIDGTLQVFGIESNNTKRVWTGLAGGIGTAVLIAEMMTKH